MLAQEYYRLDSAHAPPLMTIDLTNPDAPFELHESLKEQADIIPYR